MTEEHTMTEVEEVPPGTGRNGILAAMCLALVLVVASVSSVNLALTGISLDLGASSSQLTWIADGYTVALAALVLPFGALGDRYGRRTLLMIGTVVFGLAAIAAAAAQSSNALIVARVAMGVGAAMIMPGTLSTITAVFPAAKRARAVSVWAGFASSGAILGLLTCGLVLEWFTWRATFVATAVLAAVSLATSVKLTPNTSDPDDTVIDLPGYLFSGIGIGALIFAIIDGAESGWGATNAIAAMAVAAIALVSFVRWELRTPSPMLDVRLFALRGFTTGTLALTVQFLCLFGFFMVGLQFLQLMLGYSAIHSAVCLLPLGFVVMPLSRAAPHVVDRFGQRAVMSSGLAMLGAGLAILSQLDAESTYWHFVAGLVVFGVGMAFTSTPATTAIVTSLPQSKQGVGSAVNDLSREFGSALGIAIVGSIFNSGYSSAVADATTALPPDAAGAVEESPGAGLHVAGNLPDGGQILVDGVRGAFATGLQHALVTAAVIAGLAAVYTVLRGPSRAAEAPGEPSEALDAATETPMFAGSSVGSLVGS